MWAEANNSKKNTQVLSLLTGLLALEIVISAMHSTSFYTIQVLIIMLFDNYVHIVI
jgi:hypothetical protein